MLKIDRLAKLQYYLSQEIEVSFDAKTFRGTLDSVSDYVTLVLTDKIYRVHIIKTVVLTGVKYGYTDRVKFWGEPGIIFK